MGEPMSKTQTPTEALRGLVDAVDRSYAEGLLDPVSLEAARAALREAKADPWQELVGKTFKPVEQGAGDSPDPVPGDYVLATKYEDGDPGDQWAVGFLQHVVTHADYDRRFVVVDVNGEPFRANGFRRAEKVSGVRGGWILKQKEQIEAGDASLWYYATCPMGTGDSPEAKTVSDAVDAGFNRLADAREGPRAPLDTLLDTFEALTNLCEHTPEEDVGTGICRPPIAKNTRERMRAQLTAARAPLRCQSCNCKIPLPNVCGECEGQPPRTSACPECGSTDPKATASTCPVCEDYLAHFELGFYRSSPSSRALRALLERIDEDGPGPCSLIVQAPTASTFEDPALAAARAALREAEIDPTKTMYPRGAGDSPEATEPNTVRPQQNPEVCRAVEPGETAANDSSPGTGGAAITKGDASASASASPTSTKADAREGPRAPLGEKPNDVAEYWYQKCIAATLEADSLRAQLRERPNPTEFEQRTCCPRCASFDVQEYMGGAMACLACGHTDNCDDADWPEISAVRLELETLRAALRERPTREEALEAAMLWAAHYEELCKTSGSPAIAELYTSAEDCLDAVLAKRAEQGEGEPQAQQDSEGTASPGTQQAASSTPSPTQPHLTNKPEA